MERDAILFITILVSNISTHTLTWSVTARYNITIIACRISTHTLTWSVTTIAHQTAPLGRNFNSHAHVERDMQNSGGENNASNFNSHAHVERDQMM